MCNDAGSQSLHYLRLDITDASSVKHFAAVLEAEFGGVTVLVNNAGKVMIHVILTNLCFSTSKPSCFCSRRLPFCCTMVYNFLLVFLVLAQQQL